MIKFFPNAPDNPATGSARYTQSLIRVYYQDFQSGILELDYPPSNQYILLLIEGSAIAAYKINDKDCTAVPVETATSPRVEGDLSLRFVQLPREAVRVTREVIEWGPAVQTTNADSNDVKNLVEAFQKEQATGIMQIVWPRQEGFLTLRQGQLLHSEAVLSSPMGVEAGSSIMRMILNDASGPCFINFFEARSATQTFQQQILRAAVGQWFSGILSRYIQLVGLNLTKALAQDLSRVMRSRAWYIQVFPESINDSHVFSSVDNTAQAYQQLLKSLVAHASKVIGASLTNSMLAEAFSRLEPSNQEAIQQYSLLPTLVQSQYS